MAVAFEAISTVQSFASFPTSTQSFSFNSGSNTNLCVVVWIWGNSSFTNTGFSSVTYGGNAMTASTQVDWASGGKNWMRAFTLIGAPTGANNVVITFDGGNISGFNVVAACWSGVSALNGSWTSTVSASSDTTATLSPTSATGELAIFGFITQAASATLSPNSTEVERLDTATGVQAGMGSIGVYEKAGASGVTITANSSVGIFECGLGISLQPSGGSSSAGKRNLLLGVN